MVEANIIVETRRKTAKGYSVKIEVYSQRKYKYISLKKFQTNKTLKIDDEIADRLAALKKEVKYCNDLNLNLDESVDLIKKGIDKNPDLEIFLLKQRIKELQQETGIKLIQFFDVRIKELEELSKSTKAYTETKTQLSYFFETQGENDILINDVDYEWLQRFSHFKKKSTKRGKGGVNFYLRTIRAVFKEAQKRESLNIKKDNPFLGLIDNNTSKEVIDIPIDDIKKLLVITEKYKAFAYDSISIPENKGMTKKNALLRIRSIELWLFQFSIGGVDFADIACLKWENIYKNRISFRRYKNRNKSGGGSLVDNLLSEFSQYVIEKYGDKNTERIFSFIPYPSSEGYISCRDGFGKILNRVSQALKYKESIKTKSPRYIFRSIAGELQINTLVIMQLQGHKPEGVSYKYQKKLPYNIIDKEHRKIIDTIFTKID